MNNKVLVESDYNERESFDFDNVPRSFSSVTSKCLQKIKKYCLQEVDDQYSGDYSPQSLQAMAEDVGGIFDDVYAKLLSDHDARRNKLQLAYNSGIAQTQEDIIKFKDTIDQHNRAFKEYSDIVTELTGKTPDQNLLYSYEEYSEYDNRLKELKKENRNGK